MDIRRKPRASVIGAGTCGNATASLARELGARLAQAGLDVVCGGLGGVMQAVCQGAAENGGLTIGVLPGENLAAANPFVQVPVATTLGIMRNWLVVCNGDVVIAVEGEYGTLSELAMALKKGKTVIGLGRWAHMDGVLQARDAAHAVELALREIHNNG